ncbi:hypothetical protein F383_32527 [Gossypium arboreum]|uniref:Uncharacterized protein n=1 Tax=Gossypium arboreum TaxID=29729 RepID=A0A0B0MWA3_GOSAR|nr:hypothetical protein F383_32527 [Gossypium arboreum]
MCCREEFSPDG